MLKTSSLTCDCCFISSLQRKGACVDDFLTVSGFSLTLPHGRLWICAEQMCKTCIWHSNTCPLSHILFSFWRSKKHSKKTSSEKHFMLWHLASRSCWFYNLLGLLFRLYFFPCWFVQMIGFQRNSSEMEEIHQVRSEDAGTELTIGRKKRRRVSDGGKILSFHWIDESRQIFFLSSCPLNNKLGKVVYSTVTTAAMMRARVKISQFLLEFLLAEFYKHLRKIVLLPSLLQAAKVGCRSLALNENT